MKNSNSFSNRVWLFITKNPVMASVTAFVLITFVLVLLEPLITKILVFFGVSKPSSNIVILFCFFVVAIFFLPLLYVIQIVQEQNKLKDKVEKLRVQENKLIEENCTLQQEKQGLEENINNLKSELLFFSEHKNIGLSQVWNNYEAAKQDIREKILNIDTVKEISILIHCEADLIDSSSSVIGYALAKVAQKNPKKQPDKIRILKPSQNNPYYTNPDFGLKERAIKRQKDSSKHNDWSIEKYIDTRIERFKTKTERLNNGINKFIVDGLSNVEVREHDQPYLWNLIIVDDWIFVQGDVYEKCLSNAPILLFCDFESNYNLSQNYYYTYNKYYEYMWKYSSKEMNTF